MTDFLNFVKTAIRSSLKQRVFTLINLIGLATGVAVVLLMALYLEFELGYDSHFENSDQLYRVYQSHAQDHTRSTAGLHYPAGALLKENYPEIKQVTRIHPLLPRLGTYLDKNFMENGFAITDPEIFEVFGIKPLAGNLETALQKPTDMVITAKIAEKYFGLNWQQKGIIGETFKVKQVTEYQVAAVIPDFPDDTHFQFDIFVPYGRIYGNFIKNNWNFSRFYTYIRAAKNQNANTLETAFSDFTARYYPEDRKADYQLGVQPVRSIHLNSELLGELGVNTSMDQIYLFAAIALLILAIASMNFTNLMTAQASGRHKEVGVKKVLGAGRRQLMGQFLLEGLVVCFVAFVLAIGLADLSLGYFSQLVATPLSMATLGKPVWIIAFLCAWFIMGCLSVIYPSFILSQLKTASALKQSQGSSKTSSVLRKWLVTAQFVITTTLIVAVITVFQQLNFMRDKDLGLDQETIVMLRSEPVLNQKYDVFRNELLSHPEIAEVAFGYGNLLGGGSFSVRAMLDQEGGDEITAVPFLYSDYAMPQTLGLETVEGRWFSRDFPTDSLQAFVINETAAKAYGWSGEAIGKRIRYYGGGSNNLEKDGRVVGVVKDFFHESLYNELKPLVITLSFGYVKTFPNAYLPIRVKEGQLKEGMAAIESTWQKHVPGIPVNMGFLTSKLARMYERDQRFGALINASALLALLIASIGVFGLASFIARARVKELGIRKVLGASVGELLAMMVKGFLKPVCLAFFIAIPLSVYLLQSWLDGFAYKVNLTVDIFLFTALTSVLVAIVAVMGQSLSAARTNPVNVLRND